MKTKFKIILTALVLLWSIAFVQTLITRFYVSKSAFTQAFARNQILVTERGEAAADTRNTKEGNLCKEGIIAGKLSNEKKQQVARDIFREFGGAEVMSSQADDADYYVAYVYTMGIDKVKVVNGRKINLNVAMSYDEKEQVTRVIVGTPLINSDF